MRAPVLYTLVFAAACAPVVVIVFLLLALPLDLAHLGILLWFTAITSVLHAWQEHALTHDPKGFINRFMAGLMLKMLLSIILLVVIMLLASSDQQIPLAILFIALYFSFLTFSTWRLAALLRRPSSS